ncbi:MAG: PEP-CTERM sorting domain-containing protein [Planctomycetes bacterium]|nr:PEP-CTERM sorting domain-containing protein [Planctomycetota bacterium]
MLKTVLTLSLGFALAACADHNGTIASLADGPNAPINEPDTRVVDPSPATPSTNNPGEPQPGGGSGSGGGGGGGGSNPGGGGSGGGTPGGAGGGNEGGSPVPEPGTLLLVGTGLAGAALLRWRCQAARETNEA